MRLPRWAKTFWAAAFVVSGIGVTTFAIEIGAAVLGLSPSAPPWGAFAIDTVVFAALVALHPRWNGRWAGAAAG